MKADVSAPYRRHLQQIEQSEHRRIIAYLRKEYPDVIFRTDGGGMHAASRTQAVNFSRMQYSPGWPDLFIPVCKRGYAGLFLEIKKTGTTIYKKIGPGKGQLVNNEHIREQAAILDRLNKLGYFARFAVGEENAIKIIDWYFERPQNQELF